MEVAVEPGACPLCGPDFPRTRAGGGPDFEYRTTGAQEFLFNRCTTCGALVLDPRPVDAAIASLYPPEYEPYRFDQLNPIVRKARDFVQRAKTSNVARYARAGGTIVDVGCGNGSLLRLLRARYADRYRLIGWDYPGPHIEHLRAAGVEVIAAPIESAHVPQGVDLFVLNQVIEHVPRPDRLLTMLAGALAPGGHIVIETPDTDGVDAKLFGKRHWGGYHLPRHMVLFNKRNLRALVERCGLRAVEAANLASPAFWVQSLHHTAVESRAPGLASLFSLRNVPLVALVAGFDMVAGRLLGTSNQRLVAGRL
jgi:2-polyprenyl-3-methyl-5-hydroxy-6-metoxy-1,4-benzoquinol methylase